MITKEMVQHARRVGSDLAGGILNDLFQRKNSPNSHVGMLIAKAFEGFSEALGYLTAAGESIVASRVQQCDGCAECGYACYKCGA
ncbi:hypothetical protein ACSNOH_20245 [Streptomyces sp. URMC 127]|uniref:hypothetical protein n=1 Tax=Streptomyces sp. URMC 127 TaxID=3423402 RepID=UPI003F1A6EB2